MNTEEKLAPTIRPIAAVMAHSHSRLQVFSQCPLSYRLTYIDKVPVESSDALEIGAAAHEFFEQWVKMQTPLKRPYDDDVDKVVLDVASKCFQKEARDQSNFKDYLEICKTFTKEYKPDPQYPVVIAEMQIAFDRNWLKCGWFEPEVKFRAKIDRLELPRQWDPGDSEPIKKIRVTDYKTGYAGAMDSFQLDVYALVASLLYPDLEQVEIQFYYVKSGFKSAKLLEVKDLDVTKIQLEALMARIESETKWKAKPGVRCLNCSVAGSCSEKPSDLKAITSPDIARTLGAEIAFLEAQAKAKKKALNAYCKENGPVEAGGLVWNHYPQESMVVDMGPFLSACVACQVDPAEVLNPDSKAIKKALKETPGFEEAVHPYIGMDVTTRFYAKKAEADDD